jgi:hypothetical protein
MARRIAICKECGEYLHFAMLGDLRVASRGDRLRQPGAGNGPGCGQAGPLRMGRLAVGASCAAMPSLGLMARGCPAGRAFPAAVARRSPRCGINLCANKFGTDIALDMVKGEGASNETPR